MPASTMTLSGTSVSASIKTTAKDALATAMFPASVSLSEGITIMYAAGFAVGQADHVVSRTYDINSGLTEDIDLSSAAAAWDDAFGDDVVFHAIKAMLIKNVSALPDTEMQVGAAAATQWAVAWCDSVTSYVRVHQGGVFLLAFPGNATIDGYAVGAGVTDLLRITNAGGSNGTVQVTFLGETGT